MKSIIGYSCLFLAAVVTALALDAIGVTDFIKRDVSKPDLSSKNETDTVHLERIELLEKEIESLKNLCSEVLSQTSSDHSLSNLQSKMRLLDERLSKIDTLVSDMEEKVRENPAFIEQYIEDREERIEEEKRQLESVKEKEKIEKWTKHFREVVPKIVGQFAEKHGLTELQTQDVVSQLVLAGEKKETLRNQNINEIIDKETLEAELKLVDEDMMNQISHALSPEQYDAFQREAGRMMYKFLLSGLLSGLK